MNSSPTILEPAPNCSWNWLCSKMLTWLWYKLLFVVYNVLLCAMQSVTKFSYPFYNWSWSFYPDIWIIWPLFELMFSLIAVHDFHDIFIRMTFTTRVQLGNIAVVLAHCPKSIWPLLENTMTRPGTKSHIYYCSDKKFIVHTKNALPYIWIVRQNCLTIQTNSWACLV